MATIYLSKVEILSSNTLLVTFNEPLSTTESNYLASSYAVSGSSVRSIIVPTSAVAPIDIVLVTDKLTEGDTYVLSVSSIVAASGNLLDDTVTIEFSGVTTKLEKALTSTPTLYDTAPNSTVRQILTAIHRENGKIGGEGVSVVNSVPPAVAIIPITSWNTGFENFTSPNADYEITFLSQVTPGFYDNENDVANDYLQKGTNPLVDVNSSSILDGSDPPTPRNVAQTSVAGSTNRTPGYGVFQANPLIGNSDLEDLCLRFVFESLDDPWQASRYLARKQSLGAGYYVRSTAGGLVTFYVQGTSGPQIAISSVGNLAQAGLHYVTCFYDHSAQLIYIKDDVGGAATPVSTASLVGSMTLPTTDLHINTHSFSRLDGLNALQYAYFGTSSGANAEAMWNDDFWNAI